jgi:predicted NUDIX family phosphoesterase
MDKMQQKVLCISTEILFAKEKWNGLQKNELDHYYNLLLKKSEFKVRQDLEEDENFKQIIPQVILKNGDDYFLHRLVSGSEQRLTSLCPLPLGGHVEEFDYLAGQEKDILQVALEREVAEEADVQANIVSRDFKGLIYIEDGNKVNHVHVGMLYVFEVDSRNVKMHEEGLETIGWVDAAYLREHVEELTYWSRVFVREYLQN